MAATPLTVARLYDGVQLIKRVQVEHAATILQTNDMPPKRLWDLEAQFGPVRIVPFSVWEQTAWAGTDFIDYDDWMREFGPRTPPDEAVIAREGKPPVVVVRYADYRRTGGKTG